VSEIGFGAWQLGNANDWGKMTDSEGVQLVHKAIDSGCNFFDTAPNYGLGKSEELLGKALKGKRHSVIVNTKFGHHPNGKLDFSVQALRQSVENSLTQLQTDYLDSILLHNPPFEYLNGSSPTFEALEALKSEGKIRAYGASVDSSREMLEIMETTKSQVMEVLFNVFHQETASAFEMAKQKEIGLIIKVPLDSGWLSGKYNKLSSFEGIRSRWTREVIERRSELLDKISFMCADGTSMANAALRFILAHDAVSTVIPGIKSMTQLNENIFAGDDEMRPEIVERLKRVWEDEIKTSSLPW